MLRSLTVLTALSSALVAMPVQDRDAAAQRLMARRAQLGLDGDNAFSVRAAHVDAKGTAHTHVQQRYQGLKVWGGEAIVHVTAKGQETPLTDALHRGISLSTLPSLTEAEALAVAHQHLAPKGAYSADPTFELVVVPETVEVVRPGREAKADLNAEDVTRQVVRYTLAYHVHAELLNGDLETRSQDYLINAHTGAILKTWDSLHTAAAVGSGKSQWYGTVSLNTNSTSTGYELRDMTRGTGGTFGNNVTTNMMNGTSGNGSIMTDADNAWGDGLQYSGTAGTGANAQTAGVDGHRGLQATWDMYKNVFGRNGIDNTGKATFNRMHYSSQYDNAFWQDSCFCMTYGDGATGGSVGEADLDTAGHEMTHGVTATSANLTYSGESGGLNESISDIFGTCVEFYVLGGGGTGAVIPDAVGSGTITANYTMFENSWGHPGTALRYMYKPSKDGASKDAWSSTLGSLDVHYSSGPSNRMWYFLAKGASSTSTSDFYSSYLPGGMTGIGNDHAARIAYRALTVYMTSSTNYAGARTAYINAAKDLYGAGSADEQAVWNAFAAINVGAKWTSTDTTAPTVSASESGTSGTITFSATASDNVGVSKVEFYVDGVLKGTDTTSPYSMTLDSTTLSNASHSLTAKAYDAAGNVATSTAVSFTISNPTSGDTSAPVVSASESGTSGTISFAATASDNVGVTKVEFYVDGVLKGTDTASPYAMTLDSTTLTNATHSLTAKAYDAAGNVATSTAVSFTVSNPVVDTELVLNGGFESGATSWTATSGVIGAYTPHTGTNDAYLNGYGSAHTDYVYQQIAIPSNATAALTFWVNITTSETTTTTAYDTLKVQVLNTSGTVLATLATYSNLNKTTGWVQKSLSLAAYKGQTIRLRFYGVEDSSLATSFKVDDISVR